MSLVSAIAIYFVVWWVTLFVVLPFGVRNAHEAGETVAEGHEAGAPVRPMMWRKVLITTVLASFVFGLIYGELTRGWIGFGDLPFMGEAPKL